MKARFVRVPVHLLIPRPVRPDEVRHVRRVLWNLSADGHRLPAELGVIVIGGGRR